MNPISRFVVLCCVGSVCWIGCSQSAPTIPLSKAIENGNLKAVQQHIAAKTDLNKPDTAGWTPLQLAATKGNLAIVQALSAGGADVKRKGKGGKTALDVAHEKGNVEVIQYLELRQRKGGRGLIDGGLGVSEALDNP